MKIILTVDPVAREVCNPQFLSLKEGEILHTDGLLKSEKRSGKLICYIRTSIVWSLSTNVYSDCLSGQTTGVEGYHALNAVGSMGCEYTPQRFHLIIVI